MEGIQKFVFILPRIRHREPNISGDNAQDSSGLKLWLSTLCNSIYWHAGAKMVGLQIPRNQYELFEKLNRAGNKKPAPVCLASKG